MGMMGWVAWYVKGGGHVILEWFELTRCQDLQCGGCFQKAIRSEILTGTYFAVSSPQDCDTRNDKLRRILFSDDMLIYGVFYVLCSRNDAITYFLNQFLEKVTLDILVGLAYSFVRL